VISKTNRILIVLLFLAALAGPLAFGQNQQSSPALNAAQKKAIVDEIAQILNKRYIFPETAKKVEDALRTKLSGGGFDKASDARLFAQAVSRTILDVSKDRHMGFSFAPEQAADMRRMRGRSEEEARKVRERQLLEAQRDNFGFRKVEQLPGNIGYLDFRVFASPDRAGQTAIAALNFLAYCDAIIVDMRQNGGGDPAQIQLICSYFFREPAHLNDLYYRETNTTENYWTLPYVPGPKPVDADLYILTSSRSFSGAEEFTYNMKNLKRATIIGETTGGGAHPTDADIVQQDYVLRVPVARAINPVSKTNWEGTGVAPDTACPAAEAFDKAYALAVEKLAAKAADPARKAQYEWIMTGIKAKSAPVSVDEKTLLTYAGVYGDRKIMFENGALYYQRMGPKYKLVPMTRTLFAVESLDNLRIEFVVKDGRVDELIGIFDNGDKEPSARAK
jgi:retinol-binding protein 3